MHQRAYYQALQVYQVKDTRVITVEFTSSDSELAARAANRLAELHQDWLRSQGAVHSDLDRRHGLLFVVRDMHIDFLQPARNGAGEYAPEPLMAGVDAVQLGRA